MADVRMMLEELEALKDTASGAYKGRLERMRSPPEAEMEEEQGEMQLCPYCGAETPAVMGTCTKCGADLSAGREADLEEQASREQVFDEGLARR